MLTVKNNVQAFSSAPQVSGLNRQQNGTSGTVSALDQEKFLGDKPIGDVLNEIVDPNYIDPAKTRKVGDSNLDKDAFFKLMLTQMKNQDPTNPLKSHEMAAQLAQFTSLEQLQNVNDTLKNIHSNQEPMNNMQALNYIGKAVSGDSSKISRTEENQVHDLNYNLMGDADEAEITVKNAAGEPVRVMKQRNLKTGKNTFTWNGMTDLGQPAGAGEYSFQITAKASNGAKIGVETKFDGRITGVNFTPKGPVLLVGNQTVRISDVTSIIDPSMVEKNNQKNSASAQSTNADENGKMKIARAENAPVAKGNIENVPMSRGLINRLEKETK